MTVPAGEGATGPGRAYPTAGARTNVQSYSNHRRWSPLYHFVAIPVLCVNVVVAVVALVRNPGWAAGWQLAVAIALVLGLLVARTQALIVQNRLIRLEERLRLIRLLPPDRHDEIARLRTAHFIGLRFASDLEVPDLVRRCASGELATADAVKRAVREWRGDYMRA